MYTPLIKARNMIGLGGYKYLLKPVLFQFDPEKVHDLMTKRGRFLGSNSLTQTLTRIAFDYEDPILS